MGISGRLIVEKLTTEKKELEIMALTKKFLQSIEIPDDKIDLIFEEHAASLSGITAERDKYKEQAEKLAGVEKELVKAQAKVEDYDTLKEDFKKVRTAFDDYKADVEAKNILTMKQKAFGKLLSEAGIPEKLHEKIIKVTDLSEFEIDENGNAKDKIKHIDGIKSDYPEFIVTQKERGAAVANPPSNTGGGTFEKMSLAEKMAFANDNPDNAEVIAYLNN